MNFTDFFTIIFFLMGAGSAIVVAFHPNILYAAVALVVSLLSVSGMYGVLGADFLAAVQLIIYVGGVIVVILFAIMMSETVKKQNLLQGLRRGWWGFLIGAIGAVLLTRILWKTPFEKLEQIPREATAEGIGRALVGPYALVFQYVAVVLLAGLIGAVVVARPHLQHDEEEERG